MNIKSIVQKKFGSVSQNLKTSTNPLENAGVKEKSFSGSVLPFADVFQSIKPAPFLKFNGLRKASETFKHTLKGFKSRTTEPIALFANSVRENIESGMAILQRTRLLMYNSARSFVAFNRNLFGNFKGLFIRPMTQSPEFDNQVTILSNKKINKHASVKDLRNTWINRNEKLTNERKVNL